jgi:predicted ArsR family transcriptional regulator
MYQKVNFGTFMTAFKAHGRQDQFSYSALELLFEYLEQLEDDLGEQMELDVIALCCEYEEASVAEVITHYDVDISDDSDEDETRAAVLEYLEYHTTVIGETNAGTILFAQF